MNKAEKIMARCPNLSALLAEQKAAKAAQPDKVQTLVAGLSTATTIAQIRAVAKAILDETGGDTDGE